MVQERNHKAGHFFLGVVVLTWGANFGIVKSAYDYFPPLLFGALRFTVMGILLLFATLWREKEIRIRKEDWGRVIMVGALGLGLYQVFWSLGLNLTSPSNSALILSIQPPLGVLYVDLIKKEHVGRQQYWGMLLALVGVVLVILKPTAKLHFSLETLPGDLLTLMAGFCSAIFFSVWSKPLLKTYSPLAADELLHDHRFFGPLDSLPLFSPTRCLGPSFGEDLVVNGICRGVFWNVRSCLLV